MVKRHSGQGHHRSGRGINARQGRLILTSLLVMGLVLILAGPAAAKELLFATGGTAGTFYPLGGAIAQIWNKNIPELNVTVQATGGSMENVRLLGRKDTEVAISMNDVSYFGYKGEEAFKAKNEKITNYSAVANVYPDVVQIFASKDSGIEKIEDLKGKKISVGPPGSGTELSARQVLGLYGLDYRERKDVRPEYLSYSEAADHFKDKHIDAAYFVVAVPNAALMDINIVSPVKFLAIDDNKFKEITKLYPLYSRFEIAPESYRGQGQAIKTIAIYSSLLVLNDLPEDLVYQMTKVFFEKKDDIAKAHAAGKFIDLANAIQGIAVPIHPGAARYYKEKGLIK